jgi:rabenosyn-5
MSGRKLGGGRVLGSGKGLAAPSPVPSASASPRGRSPFPTPNSRPLPIHSSNSTSNSASSPLPSPLTDYGQDLASNVNLAGPSHDATPNGVLVCPICEDHMVGYGRREGMAQTSC